MRTQYRVSRLVSKDSILDILAEDSRGRIYNLEIQRKKDIDHARRTRLYGAMVDSEHLEKGKDYDQMPEVYVIYISETNLWKDRAYGRPGAETFRWTKGRIRRRITYRVYQRSDR